MMQSLFLSGKQKETYDNDNNKHKPLSAGHSPRTTRRWRSSPWTRQPSHPTTDGDSRPPRSGIVPILLDRRRTRRTISNCDRRGGDRRGRRRRRRERARRAIAFRSSEMSMKGTTTDSAVRSAPTRRLRDRDRDHRRRTRRRRGRSCKTVDA